MSRLSRPLEELKKLNFDTVLPGHGEAFTGKEKITAYHRICATFGRRLAGSSSRVFLRKMLRSARHDRAQDRFSNDPRTRRRCSLGRADLRSYRYARQIPKVNRMPSDIPLLGEGNNKLGLVCLAISGQQTCVGRSLAVPHRRYIIDVIGALICKEQTDDHR